MKNLLFAILLTACAATQHPQERESHTWKLNLEFTGGNCNMDGKIVYWLAYDRVGEQYTFSDALGSELCVGSVGPQTLAVSCSGSRPDMEYNFDFKLEHRDDTAFGDGVLTVTNPYATCKQPFTANGEVR